MKKPKWDTPCDECGAIHDEENEIMSIKKVGKPIILGNAWRNDLCHYCQDEPPRSAESKYCQACKDYLKS